MAESLISDSEPESVALPFRKKTRAPKGLQQVLNDLAKVALSNNPCCYYECFADFLEAGLNRRILIELQFANSEAEVTVESEQHGDVKVDLKRKSEATAEVSHDLRDIVPAKQPVGDQPITTVKGENATSPDQCVVVEEVDIGDAVVSQQQSNDRVMNLPTTDKVNSAADVGATASKPDDVVQMEEFGRPDVPHNSPVGDAFDPVMDLDQSDVADDSALVEYALYAAQMDIINTQHAIQSSRVTADQEMLFHGDDAVERSVELDGYCEIRHHPAFDTQLHHPWKTLSEESSVHELPTVTVEQKTVAGEPSTCDDDDDDDDPALDRVAVGHQRLESMLFENSARKEVAAVADNCSLSAAAACESCVIQQQQQHPVQVEVLYQSAAAAADIGADFSSRSETDYFCSTDASYSSMLAVDGDSAACSLTSYDTNVAVFQHSSETELMSSFEQDSARAAAAAAAGADFDDSNLARRSLINIERMMNSQEIGDNSDEHRLRQMMSGHVTAPGLPGNSRAVIAESDAERAATTSTRTGTHSVVDVRLFRSLDGDEPQLYFKDDDVIISDGRSGTHYSLQSDKPDILNEVDKMRALKMGCRSESVKLCKGLSQPHNVQREYSSAARDVLSDSLTADCQTLRSVSPRSQPSIPLHRTKSVEDLLVVDKQTAAFQQQSSSHRQLAMHAAGAFSAVEHQATPADDDFSTLGVEQFDSESLPVFQNVTGSSGFSDFFTSSNAKDVLTRKGAISIPGDLDRQSAVPCAADDEASQTCLPSRDIGELIRSTNQEPDSRDFPELVVNDVIGHQAAAHPGQQVPWMCFENAQHTLRQSDGQVIRFDTDIVSQVDGFTRQQSISNYLVSLNCGDDDDDQIAEHIEQDDEDDGSYYDSEQASLGDVDSPNCNHADQKWSDYLCRYTDLTPIDETAEYVDETSCTSSVELSADPTPSASGKLSGTSPSAHLFPVVTGPKSVGDDDEDEESLEAVESVVTLSLKSDESLISDSLVERLQNLRLDESVEDNNAVVVSQTDGVTLQPLLQDKPTWTAKSSETIDSSLVTDQIDESNQFYFNYAEKIFADLERDSNSASLPEIVVETFDGLKFDSLHEPLESSVSSAFAALSAAAAVKCTDEGSSSLSSSDGVVVNVTSETGIEQERTVEGRKETVAGGPCELEIIEQQDDCISSSVAESNTLTVVDQTSADLNKIFHARDVTTAVSSEFSEMSGETVVSKQLQYETFRELFSHADESSRFSSLTVNACSVNEPTLSEHNMDDSLSFAAAAAAANYGKPLLASQLSTEAYSPELHHHELVVADEFPSPPDCAALTVHMSEQGQDVVVCQLTETTFTSSDVTNDVRNYFNLQLSLSSSKADAADETSTESSTVATAGKVDLTEPSELTSERGQLADNISTELRLSNVNTKSLETDSEDDEAKFVEPDERDRLAPKSSSSSSSVYYADSPRAWGYFDAQEEIEIHKWSESIELISPDTPKADQAVEYDDRAEIKEFYDASLDSQGPQWDENLLELTDDSDTAIMTGDESVLNDSSADAVPASVELAVDEGKDGADDEDDELTAGKNDLDLRGAEPVTDVENQLLSFRSRERVRGEYLDDCEPYDSASVDVIYRASSDRQPPRDSRDRFPQISMSSMTSFTDSPCDPALTDLMSNLESMHSVRCQNYEESSTGSGVGSRHESYNLSLLMSSELSEHWLHRSEVTVAGSVSSVNEPMLDLSCSTFPAAAAADAVEDQHQQPMQHQQQQQQQECLVDVNSSIDQSCRQNGSTTDCISSSCSKNNQAS